MKIHRFIGDFDLSKDTVEITNPENIKQIKDILKLKKEEKIILSDGKGLEAETTIALISPNKIVCTINKIEKQEKIKRKVNLFLAILKKENFELATQKAVECGISSITPIITERTIKTGLNIPRLEKIILEASEQSGRNVVPTLSPILDFEKALTDAGKSEEKIIFTPSLASDGVNLGGKLYEPNKKAKDISIFIGPEGGFTEKEIELAKNANFNVASLGELTLRGETAAIVGT